MMDLITGFIATLIDGLLIAAPRVTVAILSAVPGKHNLVLTLKLRELVENTVSD